MGDIVDFEAYFSEILEILEEKKPCEEQEPCEELHELEEAQACR